ncbi:MAG: hypothetical protein QXW98_04870 [Candidatus Caldarchaeum sp.]
MKTVRFKERVPPYQPGDVAGFDDDVATRLVTQGFAEWFEIPIEASDGNATSAHQSKPGKRGYRR